MAKKKRTEMAPVLQTIKDYLANHYMDELLQELTAGMRLGEVQGLDMDCSQGEIIVDPDHQLQCQRGAGWRDNTGTGHP